MAAFAIGARFWQQQTTSSGPRCKGEQSLLQPYRDHISKSRLSGEKSSGEKQQPRGLSARQKHPENPLRAQEWPQAQPDPSKSLQPIHGQVAWKVPDCYFYCRLPVALTGLNSSSEEVCSLQGDQERGEGLVGARGTGARGLTQMQGLHWGQPQGLHRKAV